METDPFETNNLAHISEYKNLLKGMENQLAQLMVENNEEANINEPKWGVVLVPA